MSVLTSLHAAGPAALDWARAMFVQSSLLILLLLLVEFGLRQRLRAVTRCGLWMLVLLKLLLPPSFALPSSPAYWLLRNDPEATINTTPTATAVTSTRISLATDRDGNANLDHAASGLPALTPASGFLLIWAAGALALAFRLVWRTRIALRVLRHTNPASPELQSLTDAVGVGLGLRRPVPARTLADTVTPAVCGWFRPVILLPARLVTQLPPPALRAVLIHELTHIRRHDVAVNLLQAVLQVLYWWHPLVWLANARLRQAREEAVDEAVAVAMGGDTETYPATLVEVARLVRVAPRLNLGLVGMFESRGSLQQRIQRLLAATVPGSARLGGRGLAAIVAFAALVLPMAKAQPKARPASEAPATAAPSGVGVGAASRAGAPGTAEFGSDVGDRGVEEAKKAARLLVTVRAQAEGNEATYEIDGQPVETAKLEATLKARVTDAPDTLLVLRADQAVPFTVVSRVVQAATAAGVTHVSLSTAAEPATVVAGMGPVVGRDDPREAFLRRYGLQAAGIPETVAAGDSNTAPSTVAAGGIDPVLRRRYGLGPDAGGQAGGGPGGVTTSGGLSPELRRRYGLAPAAGPTTTGAGAGAAGGGGGGAGGGGGFGSVSGGGTLATGGAGAGIGGSEGGVAGSSEVDPGVYAAGGPTGGEENGSVGPGTVVGSAGYSADVQVATGGALLMDPRMAQRYGLTMQSPAVNLQTELLALSPDAIEPLMATASYSTTRTGDRLWVLDPAQARAWAERRGHAEVQVLSAPSLTVPSGRQGTINVSEGDLQAGTGRQFTLELTPTRDGANTSLQWKTTVTEPGAGKELPATTGGAKALTFSSSSSINVEATLGEGGMLVLEPLQPRTREGRAYLAVIRLLRAK